MSEPALGSTESFSRYHGDVAPDWSAVPDGSIIELLHRGCMEDPFRPLIIVDDGPRLTRHEFLEACEAFAGYLNPRMKAGDHVAVMLDNRVEYMVAFFAIVALRGTLVSIAPTAQVFDAGHILKDSQPTLVICGTEQRAVVDAALKEQGLSAEVVVLTDPEPQGLDRFSGDAPFDFSQAQCDRSEIVAVYYTSGSTGAPKGCMLHHGWWLRVIDIDLRLFRRGWQDRQLCCLPFYYADPTIQLLTSLASRGTLVAMRRFSVSRFWDVVTRYDATEILSIASIPALLMTGKPSDAEKDHRIRLAIHAGLPPAIHAELIERFGFHWHNQYGATEGGVMSRVPNQLANSTVGTGTMGVEPPGVEVRLVDDDDNEVPVGTAGEATIRGADLFVGYLGRPDETEKSMRGGYYHTGDLVRRDENGLLYFVGRKKEIIRRSGENISASEVESVLIAHDLIVDAAVIPVPHDIRGEEVMAFILPKDGAGPETLPVEQVIDWCRERLAGFKIPRFIAYRTEDFERLPSMKIDKKVLRDAHARSEVDAFDREEIEKS